MSRFWPRLRWDAPGRRAGTVSRMRVVLTQGLPRSSWWDRALAEIRPKLAPWLVGLGWTWRSTGLLKCGPCSCFVMVFFMPGEPASFKLLPAASPKQNWPLAYTKCARAASWVWQFKLEEVCWGALVTYGHVRHGSLAREIFN
eukprot:352738-Chlamydomonas_euryale.AAC.4